MAAVLLAVPMGTAMTVDDAVLTDELMAGEREPIVEIKFDEGALDEVFSDETTETVEDEVAAGTIAMWPCDKPAPEEGYYAYCGESYTVSLNGYSVVTTYWCGEVKPCEKPLGDFTEIHLDITIWVHESTNGFCIRTETPNGRPIAATCV